MPRPNGNGAPAAAPCKRKLTALLVAKAKPQPAPYMTWDTFQRGLALCLCARCKQIVRNGSAGYRGLEHTYRVTEGRKDLQAGIKTSQRNGAISRSRSLRRYGRGRATCRFRLRCTASRTLPFGLRRASAPTAGESSSCGNGKEKLNTSRI